MTFTERYPEIIKQIEKRRRKWELASMPFEDAIQLILIRVSDNYATFDPNKGEFVKWLNRVISNTIKNIWRDEYTNHAKPCVLGCPFNTGNETCSKTPSGMQCAECPAYLDWVKRRKTCHDVKQTLPLENHQNEANSIQSDFMDIEAKKAIIDSEIKKKLTKTEYKAYRMLFVQGKTEREVALALGFKQKRGKKKPRMYEGYQVILGMKTKFVKLARQIIDEENLV